MEGYKNKILEVDLSNFKMDVIDILDEDKKRFIGGSGVAAKLFLDRFNISADPLSPDNPLIVMNGPLTGTTLPGTSRFVACGKSPLTGIWGESACGGNFGAELKMAGWDGIIFKSASEKPCYLLIEDSRCKLLDGSDLWGKDIYQVTDILKARHKDGKQMKVFAIGRAGENRVRFAGIGNDKAHFAGRTGMGALMGSKKLKAIVVRGSGVCEPAMIDEYNTLRRTLIAKVSDSVPAQALRQMGTDSGMDLGMMTNDVPIKNWAYPQDFDLSSNLGGPTLTEKYLTKVHSCYACPVACKRVVRVADGPYRTEEGPGPEYETCCTFGTMIMNKDLAGVIKANELCNRAGIDTISGGAAIAFAYECYEKGTITKQDTDGLELRWGDIDAALKLIEMITERKGIGAILAEGTREAAKLFGKGTDEFLVEVKGLEAPMHDPRGWHGMGLGYAVSTRGACHLQHMTLYIEQGMSAYPETGLKANFKGPKSEEKAEMYLISEDLGGPCNSACLCLFVLGCLSATDFSEMLRVTTGHKDFDVQGLLKSGQRINLLKRTINSILGMKREDDRLPKRILTPLSPKGNAPDIDLMLKEYYALRGLDETGRPKRETLEAAGLKDLI
ncbi:MAG: aldehyde ferredoxin oxidoreductase family protein [Deltaproteobacteria bacterium]|nr:aldehyde ferredoxin oxidoreductase family protein [Deltaproteobacteria bacterium]